MMVQGSRYPRVSFTPGRIRKRRALPQQLAPGGTVDRGIHAEAVRTEQCLVRGVDDGVHPHSGDIVSDDLKRHFSFLPFRHF